MKHCIDIAIRARLMQAAMGFNYREKSRLVAKLRENMRHRVGV
jgi:hypothetical protein